tara:strand:- start:56 stop:565 length:510 start_codon:yes stop_codon:yes gene_type:complete
MAKKLECYTKPKKDGGTYTTCVEGQKGQKKPKRRIVKRPKGTAARIEKELKEKKEKKKQDKKVATFLGDIEEKGKKPASRLKSARKDAEDAIERKLRIGDATKNYVPTTEEAVQYSIAQERLAISLNMMRGSAYRSSREQKLKRFREEHAKIIEFAANNPRQMRKILLA